jgi:hypothetical protein
VLTVTVREIFGFSRGELLLLEVSGWGRNGSEIQRMGNVRCWKPLPSNGSEDNCRSSCVCTSEP